MRIGICYFRCHSILLGISKKIYNFRKFLSKTVIRTIHRNKGVRSRVEFFFSCERVLVGSDLLKLILKLIVFFCDFLVLSDADGEKVIGNLRPSKKRIFYGFAGIMPKSYKSGGCLIPVSFQM